MIIRNLNPSLDYVVKVDNFAVGEINRTQVENIYPGGKGIKFRWCCKIWGCNR